MYQTDATERMATINVRRLDDEVVRRLKQRAALNNRSLESEARHTLECAAADDLETRRRTFLDLVDRLQHACQSRRTHTPRPRFSSGRSRRRPSILTMRLVVDASVAVSWLVDEEHSAAAKRLIDEPYELHAPRLLASEVANALWRKARLEDRTQYGRRSSRQWPKCHWGRARTNR